MNILFLMKFFDVGGIEVVTNVLASSFATKGHKVNIACFNTPSEIMLSRMDERVKFYQLNGFVSSVENISLLRDLIIDNQINVVINQWGLPYLPIKTLKKATKGLDVKIISVYHNDPNTNARLKDIEIALDSTTNCFKRIILLAKHSIFKMITSRSMKYVYRNSDIYQVLSQSFIESFKDFTGLRNTNKLMAQANPVTIDINDYEYSFDKKRKEIIYVGRIDYNQKRVYRIIDTWALLEREFPDWQLTIVGDGIERDNIEKQVANLGLKHVSFEGFQDPIEYYKRASILMLTSEYEGFGLVLTEAMSFGVVPFVYGSYSAVYDIIDNEQDGLIMKYDKSGYKAELAASKLKNIILDSDLRAQMAINAIRKSKKYSLDEICKSWGKLLSKL